MKKPSRTYTATRLTAAGILLGFLFAGLPAANVTADHNCSGGVANDAQCLADDFLYCTDDISQQLQREIEKLNGWLADQVHDAKCQLENKPPNAPTQPTGPSPVETTDNTLRYCTFVTDTNDVPPIFNEKVKVTFDWGDGTKTTSGQYLDAGEEICHYNYDGWDWFGDYCVKARAHDDSGATGPWSSCKWVEVVYTQNDCGLGRDADDNSADVHWLNDDLGISFGQGDIDCRGVLDGDHLDYDDWYYVDSFVTGVDVRFRVTPTSWSGQCINVDLKVLHYSTGQVMGTSMNGGCSTETVRINNCGSNGNPTCNYKVGISTLSSAIGQYRLQVELL